MISSQIAYMTAAVQSATSTLFQSGAAHTLPSVWQPLTNQMCDQRWAPAFCLIPGGKQAIIAGGYSYQKRACVASISLYDSATRSFSTAQSRLPYPADFVLATPLPDGTVLLAGGFNDIWGSLDTASIYNPRYGTCTRLTGRMCERRELAQATQLAGGAVLITGGLNLDAGTTLADAELYNPATQIFQATSSAMKGDRFGHAACRLADGRVLVVGGTHWDLRKKDARVLDSAEIYDPSSGNFHRCAGSLLEARDRPTATLLPNGKVLIAGGQGPNGVTVTFAELFNPSTERFSRIEGQSLQPRMAHSAVALADGDVLLCGGWDASEQSTTNTCVVYDWKTNSFTPARNLPFATHDMALIGLSNGSILAAGGKVARGTYSSSNADGAVIGVGSLEANTR